MDYKLEIFKNVKRNYEKQINNTVEIAQTVNIFLKAQ